MNYFDKLDKVAIVEIGKRLSIYNDYVALLVTCKRIACFLRESLKNFSRERTTPLITLQYPLYIKGDNNTKDTVFLDYTVFLDLYRQNNITTNYRNILILWRGKYTQGYYDLSGNGKKIEITYPHCIIKLSEATRYWKILPFIHTHGEFPLSIKDNILYCNNGAIEVEFPNKSSLVELEIEIEYIRRRRKEIGLRWNYREGKEIRI